LRSVLSQKDEKEWKFRIFVEFFIFLFMLNEGDIAPNFTAKDQDGKEVKLSDYKGKRVVLYFYPKDDTPGCTKQACSLRDSFAEFEEKGIKIFGVSTDTKKSHQKFISKYALPFDLLADTEKEIVNLYGVYGEKMNYGKKYMGINRTTFLIDEAGKIAKIFKKVKVDEHADEVLEAFGEK
jgi:peroxiredoxin Q/BCP